MMNDHFIGGANLSEAWARAYLRLVGARDHEVLPLIVTVNTAFGVRERDEIRARLNQELAVVGQNSVGTVAGTIFPRSLWNPERPREDLYRRYEQIWPRVKRVAANRNGTYFRRFTAFGDGVNQLEHVLQTWKVGNHRRSALQLAVMNPAADHTHGKQRGFPCLQQVAVIPTKDGSISLTAFYATQTIFEKAYGNYLGLAHLGEFIAAELGMRMTSLTCIASVAKLSGGGQLKARRRDRLAADLSSLLQGD